MSRTPRPGDRVTVEGVVVRVLEVEPGDVTVFIKTDGGYPCRIFSCDAEDVTVVDQPVVVTDSDGRRRGVPRG